MIGDKKKLVVGISGASGAPLALACLKELKKHTEYETQLIISSGGCEAIRLETGLDISEFTDLADQYYDVQDIGANPASGTYKTEGMLIVPCSMKTIAGIHSGYGENLLLRAADVTIKEQRKLVLVARETPLSPIHLRNMYELSTVPGVVILPPMLSYYNKLTTVEEMTHHMVGKILERFGIEVDHFKRWEKPIE